MSNSNESQEFFTMLRDIIDVLYDGYCKVLKDEELCLTIQKKLKDLNNCSPREKKYKLLKIMNILADVQNTPNNSSYSNKDMIFLLLDEVSVICENIIKQLDDPYIE